MDTVFYGICYYYGKNNKYNIRDHLLKFLEIKENKKFIININIDSKDVFLHNNVKKEVREYIKGIISEEVIILTEYNWGGTIQGLWNCYRYIKNLNLGNSYMCFFEEDFLPFNNNFLEDSFKLLEEKKYIYIGEHTPAKILRDNIENTKFYKNDSRRQGKFKFKDIYKSFNLNITDSHYTDGGFYFSSIKNLGLIEEKIGIFHKGDQNKKYHHFIDGIALGEVGFPSLVSVYFKFTGLQRNKYFTHRD